MRDKLKWFDISIPLTPFGEWDQRWLMWCGGVSKQVLGHWVLHHTHWNPLSRFLIDNGSLLTSQCGWTKSLTTQHLFSLADWIRVMETKHLISILYGRRYQMAHAIWKSTFPLIRKWKPPVCREKRWKVVQAHQSVALIFGSLSVHLVPFLTLYRGSWALAAAWLHTQACFVNGL